MKIKIVLIAMIIMCSSVMVKAQDMMYEARTSFGIFGGVNFQSLNGKDADGDNLDNDMIIGYHAGVNVQLPIVPEFFFEPGLLFSLKGAKGTTGPITGTYKLSYVELPLNFVYKGLLGNGYVSLGFGPYLGYAVNGKAEFESGSVSLDTDIEFQNEIDASDPLTTIYFRPFDAGANIFAGYEMEAGLFLRFNAQLGLLNIYPEDNRFDAGDTRIANTGFGLSLGYRF